MGKKYALNTYHALSLSVFSLFFSFNLMTGSAEFLVISKNNFNYFSSPVFFLQLSALAVFFSVVMISLSFFLKIKQDEKKDKYMFFAGVALLALAYFAAYLKYNDRTMLALYSVIFTAAVFALCQRYGAFDVKSEKESGEELTVLLGLAAASIAVLGIIRGFSFYDAFFNLSKDLGVLVNSIWRAGEDGTQFTYFDGYRDQRGAHFQPVIYLFALLFKINCSPYILLFLQVIFSISAVIFLFMLAEKLLADKKAAFLISLAFLVSAYTSRTFVYDFHFDSMYMMFFFAFLYLSETRRFWPAAAVLCLALAVKEEAAVYMAFASVFIFFRNKEKKYLALAAASGAYAAAVIGFLIPSFGSETGTFAGQVIDKFKSGFIRAIDAETAAQLAVYFLSAALLPLLAPVSLLLLILPPAFIHTLMYINKDLFLFDVQYASFVAPPLFAAVIYGLSKPAAFGDLLKKNTTAAAFLVFLLQAQVQLSYMLGDSWVYKAAGFIITAALAVLAYIGASAKPRLKYGVMAVLSVLVFYAGYFKHYEWRLTYVPEEHRQSINRAMGFIPAGKAAAVVTNTNIAPHLCCRKYIFAMELSTPEEIMTYLAKDKVGEFYLLAYLHDFTYGGINPGDRTKRLFFLAHKMGYKLEPLFGDGITAVARLSR